MEQRSLGSRSSPSPAPGEQLIPARAGRQKHLANHQLHLATCLTPLQPLLVLQAGNYGVFQRLQKNPTAD